MNEGEYCGGVYEPQSRVTRAISRVLVFTLLGHTTMPEQGEREGKGQTASVIYNVRPRILNVVRDIKALTLTSIGPEGSVKCLLAHPESGSPVGPRSTDTTHNTYPCYRVTCDILFGSVWWYKHLCMFHTCVSLCPSLS